MKPGEPWIEETVAWTSNKRIWRNKSDKGGRALFLIMMI
jgi:hypothetical protein